MLRAAPPPPPAALRWMGWHTAPWPPADVAKAGWPPGGASPSRAGGGARASAGMERAGPHPPFGPRHVSHPVGETTRGGKKTYVGSCPVVLPLLLRRDVEAWPFSDGGGRPGGGEASPRCAAAVPARRDRG